MVDHVQCVNQERLIYSSGCISHLVYWIQSTRDIMFVLLYCVISFLKLCFLGILRYEIKEMIQKIKILQGELKTVANLPEILESSKVSTKRYLEHNGTVVTGIQEPQGKNRIEYTLFILPE
ncbi:hypothetical protein M8J77_010788 [Diaphorina citri]|nr:hypothetical protein M8J77_010788 [Diaphorina citri]